MNRVFFIPKLSVIKKSPYLYFRIGYQQFSFVDVILPDF